MNKKTPVPKFLFKKICRLHPTSGLQLFLTLALVFSCELCEVYKNTLCIEYSCTTVSVPTLIQNAQITQEPT